jgi:hypothetical protein
MRNDGAMPVNNDAAASVMITHEHWGGLKRRDKRRNRELTRYSV